MDEENLKMFDQFIEILQTSKRIYENEILTTTQDINCYDELMRNTINELDKLNSIVVTDLINNIK